MGANLISFAARRTAKGIEYTMKSKDDGWTLVLEDEEAPKAAYYLNGKRVEAPGAGVRMTGVKNRVLGCCWYASQSKWSFRCSLGIVALLRQSVLGPVPVTGVDRCRRLLAASGGGSVVGRSLTVLRAAAGLRKRDCRRAARALKRVSVAFT